MALSQRIIEVWRASNYGPPAVPLIYHENQYMATIADEGAFVRFMKLDGSILMALSQRCQQGQPDPTIGTTVYVCGQVTPILCAPSGGPEGARDLFVLNNIIPLLT
jgi:hypothetical protein